MMEALGWRFCMEWQVPHVPPFHPAPLSRPSIQKPPPSRWFHPSQAGGWKAPLSRASTTTTTTLRGQAKLLGEWGIPARGSGSDDIILRRKSVSWKVEVESVFRSGTRKSENVRPKTGDGDLGRNHRVGVDAPAARTHWKHWKHGRDHRGGMLATRTHS